MARRGLNRHRRGCRWRHAAACLLVAVLGGAASVRSAPLEVYGRLPRIEEVALSPDGSRIAFVKTEENNRVVTAFSVAAHTLLRGLRVGQQKLRYIEWADDNHLLIVTSVTTVPWGSWVPTASGSRCRFTTSETGTSFWFPRTMTSTRS